MTAWRQLRRLGVGLAVDDFGTGYSSLTRVADLHASVLKLDRSLVLAMADTRTAEEALMLARRFGMRVVAEGIETIDQLQRMRDIGCDAVQGYLTGRPVAIGQANAALSSPPILPTVRSKSGHRPRGSGIRQTPQCCGLGGRHRTVDAPRSPRARRRVRSTLRPPPRGLDRSPSRHRAQRRRARAAHGGRQRARCCRPDADAGCSAAIPRP